MLMSLKKNIAVAVSRLMDRVFASHPRLKLLKLRVCAHPNPLRERGIVFLRFTQCLRKSLADASGYDKSQCFSASEQPQR
jgi:hypothetical protein